MSINKTLLNKIKEMADIDQGVLLNITKLSSLHDSLFKLEYEQFGFPGKFKKRDVSLANLFIYTLNEAHNAKIKRLINEFGYPTQAIIGEEGMHLFGVLIQQQVEDLDLQRECIKHCDFPGEIKAHIIDKMLLIETGKQRYGTQYYEDNQTGDAKSFPIEEPEKVISLREEMGIAITINKELARMTKRYQKMRNQKRGG